MARRTPEKHIAELVQILTIGFSDYRDAFATITQRAAQRFEQRDWQGMRRDTLERLDLYTRVVNETAGLFNRRVGPREPGRLHWEAIKTDYHGRIIEGCDAELACTFFNSVTRKIFNTVGFDPRLAFTDSPAPRTDPTQVASMLHTQTADRVVAETVRQLINHFGFRTPFIDLEADARLCAERIRRLIRSVPQQHAAVRIEMVRSPFFRGMSAYLVGRLQWGEHQWPMAFAINNETGGLYIDALLSGPEELRIVFSFSRAYFHVRCDCPHALVTFLQQLMPSKRVAEIYIGLGFNKHGKTELYRDLLEHQRVCGLDRFDFSPGKRGMVMVAFNMPRNDLIYKLIRDRFASPKRTSAKQVMDKYDYVFKHDRAGRLVDVQTFENLKLDACCFTSGLLEEIRTQARTAANVQGEDVILHHAYVERLVTPLDVYLQQAGPQQARAAVIDYGQAIRDLAQVNVFPGDLLIKNFGVTSLGRVVFYDYDEVCRLTDCNFRKLPQARRYEDELSDEPWFMVAENDVFPEEFAKFLGIAADLQQVFMAHHGDLLRPEYWRRAQAQINAGIWTHIRPYGEPPRLRPEPPAAGNG